MLFFCLGIVIDVLKNLPDNVYSIKKNVVMQKDLSLRIIIFLHHGTAFHLI